MADERKKKFGDVFSAGGTDEEKKARQEAGSIIAMGAMLAGGIFQVLWMSFTPRMLGDRDMGLYGPMVALFYMLANLAGLGIPQTIMAFVSHHYENDFEEAKKFIQDGVGLLYRLSILYAVAVTLGALALGYAGVVPWDMAVLAIVLTLSISVTFLFWGMNGVLNGFQRLDLVSLGNLIYPVGVFGGTVALIWVTQRVAGSESQWDVVFGIGGQGVGHAMAFVAAAIVVNRLRKFPVMSLFSFGTNNGLYGRILRFGGLTAAAMISASMVQQMTPVVVRIVGMKYMLFGDTAEACESAIGHFSTAMIFGMATMLLAGVAIALAPAISEAESQGRQDLMQAYYHSALKQSFTVLGLFIFLFIPYVGNIIEFMDGPEFPSEIMHPLGVLSVVGGSGASLLFVLAHLFIGLKRPATAALCLAAVLVLLVVITACASIYFKSIEWAFAGLIGATWAGNLALILIARASHALSFPIKTVLKPAAAGLPGVLAALFLLPDSLPFILAGIAIIVASYFLILWLMDKLDKTQTVELPPA